jgi:hypothetical protein
VPSSELLNDKTDTGHGQRAMPLSIMIDRDGRLEDDLRGAECQFPQIPFLRTWPPLIEFTEMDRQIARTLLDKELGKLRQLSYAELLPVMKKVPTNEIIGPDGKRYQIECQAFWDSKEGGNIRVMVCVDDGGWSAFKPLSAAFIISPSGSFISE